MAGERPLHQLRKLGDEIRRLETLYPERDRLIRLANEQGSSQQQIADAAGLSQSRVQEVITGHR